MDIRYKDIEGGSPRDDAKARKADPISCEVRIRSRSAAAEYIRSLPPRFAGSLLALFLDADFNLLALDQLGEGSAIECSPKPASLARRAARLGAIGFVLIHYAPERRSSGSLEEYQVTKEIGEIAESLDLYLLDHLILAGDRLIDISF